MMRTGAAVTMATLVAVAAFYAGALVTATRLTAPTPRLIGVDDNGTSVRLAWACGYMAGINLALSKHEPERDYCAAPRRAVIGGD